MEMFFIIVKYILFIGVLLDGEFSCKGNLNYRFYFGKIFVYLKFKNVIINKELENFLKNFKIFLI